MDIKQYYQAVQTALSRKGFIYTNDANNSLFKVTFNSTTYEPLPGMRGIASVQLLKTDTVTKELVTATMKVGWEETSKRPNDWGGTIYNFRIPSNTSVPVLIVDSDVDPDVRQWIETTPPLDIQMEIGGVIYPIIVTPKNILAFKPTEPNFLNALYYSMLDKIRNDMIPALNQQR